VLGSILTRQYRFATRGIEIGLRTAQQAVDVAGAVVDDLAGRLGLGGNGHGNGTVDTDVMPAPAPAPGPTTSAPEAPAATRTASAPEAPAAPPTASAPEAPPAPPTASAPEAPPAPPTPSAPAPVAAQPPPPPAHVSTEPELVEAFSEPGAEDGAGAQVHVGEPWPGYRGLKARDVVARLPFATREELAAVELFERAGANRKSVIVAAQLALKKASPPR
jgi:hypothetical protein